MQGDLLSIGEPLHQTTFVVIDLETTGASARSGAGITEIGAVKTRGGEVIGEFQTLVDPGMPIPPMIVALTGITDAMVTTAPRIEAVLPSLIEFMGDAVLVAHNAPFDIGFLKAAFREHGYRWPGNQVVDTVLLARRATTKEEAPNKKLATLARVFSSPVTPTHRALDDARATAHVLHGMLERLARFGITHREDLDALRASVPENVRKKATLADAVPAAPGVYVFRGPRGEWLYVGTSRNLRARVKSYFTKAEQRRSMRDMVSLAVAVDTFVVPTALEAAVLEVRLIDRHRPRYNRRSARPERTPWLRLTDERYPRASLTRSADAIAETAIGPMRGGLEATLAVEVLQIALGLRTCTTRLPATPRSGARACILKDLGTCSAPCVLGEASGYDEVASRAAQAMLRDPSEVVSIVEEDIAELSERLEYERAARLRDGLSALVAGSMRAQRLRSLRGCRIIAARRSQGAWDVVSVVDGALTGSARVERGVWEAARALREGWDEAPADPLVEERELVLDWLEDPHTRLLVVEGDWAHPMLGAGRHRRWVDAQRGDHAQVTHILRDAVVA
ncbi:MAG: DEDD exonuclease domain-containing protein [Actinomycetes bacterium]